MSPPMKGSRIARSVIAAFLSAAFLWTLTLSVSPQLHERLGRRRRSGHRLQRLRSAPVVDHRDLLDAGHDGVLLVNSDSPTLPLPILQAAVDAVRRADNVVLSPALDGGYTLIGLSKPHRRLFEDIRWSTSTVYRRTLDRAREIGLPVVDAPPWYDVDDAASLRMLEDELSGETPAFLTIPGAEAPSTRLFLRERQMSLADPAE